MYEKGARQKQAIVEAADRLFYVRGYGASSFTDIAQAAEFNRGNFYHYFKSKEDILTAVAELRLDEARARLAGWDAGIAAPLERLEHFLRLWTDAAEDIARYGCPLGTLMAELGKGDRRHAAMIRPLTDLYLGWIEAQFAAMGLGEEADAYAQRLLALIQGEAMLAHLLGDADHLRREAGDIGAWLATLA